MGIGFRAPIRETSQALKTLDDVENLLKGEIVTCKEFERNIAGELREVKDLESNLKLIIQQIETLRRLAYEREAIVLKLLAEGHRRESKIDLKVCKGYIEMVERIDSELMPMITTVYNELARLILKDTHEIYRQSDKNRDTMHWIDTKARELSAEIIKIRDAVISSNEHVTTIREKIKKFEVERSLRGDRKPGSIGF